MPYKSRMHARFPPARIKRIMQMDEEVGKVSSTVPVMVSRALERFLEHIMLASASITSTKEAKTLTPQHILEVVSKENRLLFLKETVLKSFAPNNNSTNGNSTNESNGGTSVKKEKHTYSSKKSKQVDENYSDLDE